MKPILNDYCTIFLTCPLGGLMSAAKKRVMEKVEEWAKKDYTEELTFADLKDFVDSFPDTPLFPAFVEKVINPLLEKEKTTGETAVAQLVESLEEEGMLY